jgi:DNA-binding GntR family transcriptional regulator
MRSSFLAQKIAGEITELIRQGRMGEDSHLSTQEVADRFGVSRSPARDAMQMLADAGVLELKPNRGFFVRNLPNSDKPNDIVHPPLDGPSEYYALAEDWLHDRIPEEVTEQVLRDRYSLTKAQLADILNLASREGWMERKQGYGWRFLPVAKTPEALEQIYRLRFIIEPAGLIEPSFQFDRGTLKELRDVRARYRPTSSQSTLGHQRPVP